MIWCLFRIYSSQSLKELDIAAKHRTSTTQNHEPFKLSNSYQIVTRIPAQQLDRKTQHAISEDMTTLHIVRLNLKIFFHVLDGQKVAGNIFNRRTSKA